MRTIITIIALLLITGFSIQSQIIHVPQDQATIQAAIKVANEHDTVLVAPGEYFENINFLGKNIVVCSNYAIANDPNDILFTVINGSLPVHADTGSCVLIVSGEDSTAVLQGFTITGGIGTRWEDEHNLNHWYTEGGGILIQYSSPTIKNNIITENEAINASAGITSAGGGAIRSGDSNPHILNNIISYNQGRYGGGIVMNYSGAVIKNNVIIGNYGGEDYGGGGLWFLANGDHQLRLENNAILNNSSALGGGGIRLWYSNATLTNNIFWGNTASSSSQIQGNQGTVEYCCIEGGFSGNGNIETNPDFITGTFILSDDSPCIDAGQPDELFNDPEDPANPGYALYPAKGTVHSDIGVYGGPGCTYFPDIITGINQFSVNRSGISVNIFPNPVSSTLYIEIESDHGTELEIQICDSNSVIKKISSGLHDSNGRDIISSDVSDLLPGIYFITIRSGEGVQVLKCVKI